MYVLIYGLFLLLSMASKHKALLSYLSYYLRIINYLVMTIP